MVNEGRREEPLSHLDAYVHINLIYSLDVCKKSYVPTPSNLHPRPQGRKGNILTYSLQAILSRVTES